MSAPWVIPPDYMLWVRLGNAWGVAAGQGVFTPLGWDYFRIVWEQLHSRN